MRIFIQISTQLFLAALYGKYLRGVCSITAVISLYVCTIHILFQHGAGAIHYTITHCSLDKTEILQMLISAGADVNLLDYVSDNLRINMP